MLWTKRSAGTNGMLSRSEVRGSHLPKSKILTTVERAPAVLKVRTSRFYAARLIRVDYRSIR